MRTLLADQPRTRSRRLAPLLVVAMAFGASGVAAAQPAAGETAPEFYERFAFEAADTDGDGFISEAELARDAAAGFSGLDQDRSGTLPRRNSRRTIRRCSPGSTSMATAC